MKFNVKPSDCKFVINKDKKTIVCVYEGCKNDFVHFIEENSMFQLPIWTYVGHKSNVAIALYRKLIMPDRFTGIAVCGENDEWNENTGKLIAFSRMKDKLNRSFFKRANAFINTMDKYLDETVELLNTIGEKLEVNQNKRHENIEKCWCKCQGHHHNYHYQQKYR